MRNLIKAGLRRFSTSAPTQVIGDRHATIIAISARKGGVGKTTTSVNLAAGLARYHDKKVLLIDLDPQGHVHTALKEQVAPGGGALSLVLSDEGAEMEVADIAAKTNHPNLDVTPYDPDLARTEDLLSTRIGKEFLLRDALRVTRTHYDYILIDCPPNLGNLTLNGLVAADQVIIPCDPSPLALRGVKALVKAITTIAARLNPEIDVLGILLTRVDGRNVTLNTAIEAEINDQYGSALLPVRIGINSALGQAQMTGVDVFTHDETCRGAVQYRELAGFVTQAV